MTTTQREIVIVGGGIIGCTTAYYLSCHPDASSSSITLLEASEHGPAQGASGKAGGLVAKWAYPRELVDVSFKEHVKLAEEHNGTDRWGWRYVGCGSWEGRGEKSTAHAIHGTGVGEGGEKKSLEKHWDWKDDLTDSYSPMAGDGATAQVHPYQFTTSMLELAQANGVAFMKCKATSILQAEGKVTGVEYTEGSAQETKTLPATHVIVAAGAWSPSLVAGLPVSATRAHSITIRPKPLVTIAPYVLFTEIRLASSTSRHGAVVSPEIYARPGNEVYACGPGDNSPLPDSVDDVAVSESACESIREHVSSISQELREGTVEKRQACFLPTVVSGGGPLVGEADRIAKGLILATGHTCWGICNAPGTARAIAELIMEGRVKCANLKKLEPSRLM